MMIPIIESELQRLREAGNLRIIPSDSSRSGRIDFSSNDYLGISQRDDLRNAFLSQMDRSDMLMSSSASRLLARNQDSYTRFESQLEAAYGRDALIFNSGYHANTGLVTALAMKDYTIVADKLVHASIIDGIKLSGAPFERFRHNDMKHLHVLCEKIHSQGRKIFIIVESVYSMDGDTAPLPEIAEIKRRYSDALLYVDEAHAIGVEGPGGLGLSISDRSVYDNVDVVVGTLGKALCSVGAYAICNNNIKQWAVNRARSFIFSTSLPPINIAWSNYIFAQALTMDSERQHLKDIGRYLGDKMDNSSDSHIQRYIAGTPQAAVAMSEALRAEGLDVLPIRTPTVPPGTDRLRISLSAMHGKEDIDKLVCAIKRYKYERKEYL